MNEKVKCHQILNTDITVKPVETVKFHRISYYKQLYNVAQSSHTILYDLSICIN